MENIFGSNHFNTIATYLKKEFGCRIIKLSLDAGFICPNRDGSKGIGGCIFCSDDGSGHFASTIPEQIQLLSSKWPSGKYIAYFQSHTNTYAPVNILRKFYEEALAYPNVIGLSIATRPDCLSNEILDLLDELNKKSYLWIELGLQTMHDNTRNRLNCGYSLTDFEEAMRQLKKRNIKTVVHLILGLPWETKKDMLDSVSYVGKLHPFGVKLHLLHVIKNTRLADLYPLEFKTLEKNEYINLVVDALEQLPQDITIHRITGDAPANDLIAPLWSINKRSILNGVQKEFKRRESFQGKYCRE
ncbi:TIGR01212 family radical SAM protein [Anaerovorax sp. IOR16]|uniref:TIGR01212 family radical SAM protein n=1 Tax=Anaerovorax sp. IOR16 TaxID=2773458 RepID=UPI0019D24CB0|nr:TIGR01212 family radical SAM protein [Anaerovorax sp. IOR16]